MRCAIAQAPGTCGELVQGFCGAGTPFHVTCPIRVYARAEISVETAPDLRIEGLPAHGEKMRAAILQTARLCRLDGASIRVAHRSALDVGKGMASSTADILCCAVALGRAVGKVLSCEDLAGVATSIESSDGIMYPGIAAVNHKNGERLRSYAWWPEFHILMVIPRETLDTSVARFERKDALAPRFDEILSSLDRASREKNETLFADAATQSAELNQAFVPNPHFGPMQAVRESLGAIGLNVAHTGTMMGLLFSASDAGRDLCEIAVPTVRTIVGEDCTLRTTQIEGRREW